MEGHNELGISIRQFFNLQINWPEAIAKKLVQKVVNRIDSDTQDNLNQLKVEKLNNFGIYDRVLIANVLSKNDADFEVIMGEVRAVSADIKNQAERDEKMLEWLANHNYLTRADVQNVIASLTNRVNDTSSLPINKGNGLLTSDNVGNQNMLGNTDGREDGNQGGIEIRKRKLNLPDNKDSGREK